MGTKATARNSAPRELPPTGLQKARLIWIMDLGTQKSSFNNVEKLQHKIALIFEFSELFPKAPFDDKKPANLQPFVLTRRLTVSTHKKSKTLPFLEGWLGRALTPAEKEEFDFSTMLNKAGMVNIVHQPDEKDPTIIYANINSISPMIKGSKMMPHINPLIDYSIGAPNQWEEFEKIYEAMQNKIKESPEWQSEAAKAQYKTSATAVTTDGSGADEPGEYEGEQY